MKHTPISNKDHRIAMAFGLITGLFLSLSGAFGKALTTINDINFIVFARFFIPFILIAILHLCFNHQSIKTIKWHLYIIRAIAVVTAQYCLFYLLIHGNILLAVLLYSTNALISPILGKLFFYQAIKIKTAIAICLGFVGTSITLLPLHQISWDQMMIGLLSGLMGAISQVILHNNSQQDNPITINFVTYGLGSLITLIFVFPISSHLSTANLLLNQPHMLTMMILVGLFSLGNKISRTLAYKRLNKAASLAPYTYSALVFSAIIDWTWLGIAPTWNVYLGISLIILSSVIMSIRHIKTQPQRSLSHHASSALD